MFPVSRQSLPLDVWDSNFHTTGIRSLIRKLIRRLAFVVPTSPAVGRWNHNERLELPLSTDIRVAEQKVRAFGREHGMALSIAPMVTDEDHKLAIGPSSPIASSEQS